MTLGDPATDVYLADVTLLPRGYVDQIGTQPATDEVYEIQSFDGESRLVNRVEMELVLLGRKFTGQFLLIDQPIGILGRNILNALSITFDGPRSKWGEHKH